MTEGIFGDLGVDADEIEVPSGSGGPPPGIYPAFLSSAVVKTGTKKDETAVNIILSYTLEGETFQYPVDEYFGMPKRKGPWDKTTVIGQTPKGDDITEDSNNKWLLGIFKKRVLSLGVPEDKVNTLKLEHLIGVPVVLKLVKNGDYTNIARTDGVNLRREQTETLPTPTASPAFGAAWG